MNQNTETPGDEKPVEDEKPTETPASDQVDGAGASDTDDVDVSK